MEDENLDLDKTESVEVPQRGSTEVGGGSRGILIQGVSTTGRPVFIWTGRWDKQPEIQKGT